MKKVTDKVLVDAIKKNAGIISGIRRTLKEKYGYLIIPALKNIDKTDCLTLKKDDACKNVDELLELCGSFK